MSSASRSGMLVFALQAGRRLGEKVAACLDLPLARHEEREFEDGEHKIRPLENVRGRAVFVVHSLYSEPGQSVNDKICRLLFFISALKDAHAGRVIAVVPYFAYARKDRKTKPRDPLTMKYLARLFEAAGLDHVVGLDVHNLAAFQNAFRIPTDHLEARVLFAPHLARLVKDEDVAIVSPDAGGVKRAELFRKTFSALHGREAAKAFMEKQRSGGVLSGEMLVGEVRGRTAIIVDDIISSGGTIARAVDVLRAQGARRVMAAATHGMFVGEAGAVLAHPGLERVLVSDSIPSFRLPKALVQEKLQCVSVAPLVAEAIRRIADDGSLTSLLEEYPGLVMKELAGTV